uniref:Retrovirus-related Pol polyprotein from transposon TNT 1-94 n=1 Tax=Tanacetum cinerariifolium TaxID=118510 RepID=A0A6L2J330_TANCI|nr:retrovirus-related Pol polyprotein from transposon TNT 1-94 [Tanacetum cinerariifolium]
MLQAPIEGYGDAIVVPQINANNFELKQTLINLVQSNQFTGGNFMDKIPRECLSIIESKSNQIAASLEDKLDIRMNRFEKSPNDMKNSFVTPTAPIKAVEEVCVTCGANHSYNQYPLTRGNNFPVFHDNIQQFQAAAVGNFIQNRNQNINQMRPPGFNQPNQQNNQSRYQGNNFNSNQNCQNNQGVVYQNRPQQAPNYQAPAQQNTLTHSKFKAYTNANDANMNNLQLKFDNFQKNQQDFQKKIEQKQDDFQNQMMNFMQNLYNNKPSSLSSLPSDLISSSHLFSLSSAKEEHSYSPRNELLFSDLSSVHLSIKPLLAKVTTIKESKGLTSLSLDELIGNLKVHEMIIKKDSEIVKAKGERKSLALKAKKESSDGECSTFGSEDEEYAMAVRDFKKFFKRREFPKPPKEKNQRAFVGGSCSESGEEDDEKVKDETCLVAQASSEICHGVDLEPYEWIKDSGCSKHITGNRKLFSSYKAYNGGNVSFGSNLRGNVIGKASKELVRNLPKLKFDQHFCDACKIRKQAHASHKAKNIASTIRCLELLHMDVFGPSAIRSYEGNRYTLVIVDDYSRKVKESLNVTFDETSPPSKTSPLVDDDLDEEEAIKETLTKEPLDHKAKTKVTPKNVNEALTNYSWIVAMQEELDQFIANDVWELVPQPRNMTIIGTKWVFRNKLDENGIVSRKKARLVAQGYNQQEGIDYDETYALGTSIEIVVYANFDHAGDYVDRKSTSDSDPETKKEEDEMRFSRERKLERET